MRWLWIDRIVEFVPRDRLVAVKCLSYSEEHMHDHFEASPARPGSPALPALPVMPASLMIEGVAQSSGILVGHAEQFREKVVLAKVALAEFDEDATIGAMLRYTVRITQIGEIGASTSGIVEAAYPGSPRPREVGPSDFRPIGRVDLVLSHLDRNMSGLEFPSGNFVFSDSFRTLLRTCGIEVEHLQPPSHR